MKTEEDRIGRWMITLSFIICHLSFSDAVAQVRHYTVRDGLATGDVWQIVELPNGQMLVNSEGTFELFNGQRFVSVKCDAARCYRLPKFGGYAHQWQGDSLLWLRDYYNVYLFDARQRCFRYDIESRTSDMKDFIEGKVGMEARLDNSYEEMLRRHGITALPHLATACCDRQGGVWIGTQGQGLYYLSPAHPMAKTIPAPHGKPVMAMAECNDGLLVCTEDGIWRYDSISDTFTLVRQEQGALFHNAIKDNQGRVWLSSQNGLYCYGHGQLEQSNHQNVSGFIHSQVRFARPLPDGRLLVCNHLHYLGYLLPDKHEFHPLNEKLPQIESYRTIIDACLLPGTTAAAVLTQNGIFCIDYQTDSITAFEPLPAGLSQKFNCAFVDSKQRVWIGTQNGLAQGNRILLDACIKGITEDKRGNIWATTSMGIVKISPNASLDYDEADGIPEEGLRDRGILTAVDSTIWLASTKGLTCFVPEHLGMRQAPMPVTLVGLAVCDEEQTVDSLPLSLTYDKNYLIIRFSALNYACPQRTHYHYRLRGFDTSWLTSATGNGLGMARYNALPPGNYTFEVQAAIGDGEWGPLYSKSITILPPWWLTWWAKMGYGLIVLAVLATLIVIYLKRKKAQLERENEAKVNHLFELREEARHQFAENVNIDPSKISINKEEEELVSRLMKAIEKNMDNTDYTVDQLASDVALSRSNLYRRTQSMLGITPNDFLRNVRIKHAAHLLSTTELPVNQIALMVGFNSPRYFSQYFRSTFGVIPSEYRSGKKAHD